MFGGSIKKANRDVVALPKVLVRDTLLNFHDHPFSAHLRVEKTYKKISESTIGREWTCVTTKYAIARACKHADSKTTVSYLLEVISQFGAIEEIHSDRGLRFTAKIVKDLLQSLDIKNTNSVAYRPDVEPEILIELEKLREIKDDIPGCLLAQNLKNKKGYVIHKKGILFEEGERVLVKTESKEVNSKCVEFKAINKQVLEKIRKDKNTLEQYLATDENSRRKRNSYFGVIGKIQKTLFRVLTEEEGKEFSSKIKELEDKQLRIMIIKKEQAIVLKNTVNNVSQTLADFQNFRNTVGEKISNISIELQKQSTGLRTFQIEEVILKYATTINTLVTQLSIETDILLNAMISAHKGVISSHLIHPSVLLEQLTRIKNILPVNVNLPLDININNFFEFVKISQKLVFRLYRIINLPVQVEGNNFVFLQNTADYIIIDSNKQYYAFLSQDQLNQCKGGKHGYLCELTIPILTNINDCEFLIFTQSEVPKTCQVKVVRIFREILHKLSQTNTWLYATREPKKLVINCQEKLSEIIIERTGLLKLDPQCKIHTKNTVIFATQCKNKNVTTDFIPTFNLPDQIQLNLRDNVKMWNYSITNENVPQYFSDLKDSAKALETIDQEITENLKTNSQKQANLTHSFNIGSIGIIIIITIVWKL
ncbi:Uncharacterized protein FWK35_00029923 [Aphis craccivora]|uniref:Integrase catalytic domain-containing protein n=1 Tax=Aphis craccivora TaxID=307492 RepID=A0A6G0Y215_APHCR|nr:Uncharacterized protein FWK35_00029923 [Aphis craccivora]